MRRLWAVLVVLAGVAAAGGAQAQNYPWCAQYSGKNGGGMNCGFVSFEQCLATVRGIGGFCIANNTYQPPAGPHPTHRAPHRHGHKSS